MAHRSERGQALVLVAVSLTAIMAFTALAVDMGYMFYRKRQMQTAADAAAFGGVSEIPYGGGAKILIAARADAQRNGFMDGTDGTSVTATPQSLGRIEAVVSQPQGTFFARVLGVSSVPLSARAVAFRGSSRNCVYALDVSGPNALEVDGADLLLHCGVMVHSTSGTALVVNSSLHADDPIGVAGLSVGDATWGTSNRSPITMMIPPGDPLEYLAEPSSGGCDFTNRPLTSSGAVTLVPGTYCGDATHPAIHIDGTTAVTLTGGTYVLNGGGLSIGGNVTINGSAGVTLYNTSSDAMHPYGPVSIASGGSIDLHAPTAGGMLFFDSRGASGLGHSFSLNAGSTYEGTLYAKYSTLTFTGSGAGAAAYTIIVANRVRFANGGSWTINNGDNYRAISGGSPIKTTYLVE